MASIRSLFPLFLTTFLATSLADQLDYRKIFSGNGNVTAATIATDSHNNLWIVANTTAFNLPVKNAAQPRNPASSIVVSDDLGLTWSPLGFIPDLPYTGLNPPAIHPRNSDLLIASGTYGVYRSADAGQNWSTVVDLNPTAARASIGYVDQVLFDPNNPSNVYVAASGGVLKSTDTGLTWTLLTAGLAAGNCCTGAAITADPSHPGRFIYSINARAYRTNDAGATWGSVPTPSGLAYPKFQVDPVQPSNWYVHSSEGAYRSLDAGTTWTRLNVNTRLFWSLVVDPSTSGVLYALTAEALLRSTDHGDTWTPVHPPPTVTNSEQTVGGPQTLSIQPGNSNRLVVCVSIRDNPSTYLSFRSDDAGQTWIALPFSRYVYGFQFDLQHPNRLYAGGSPTNKLYIAKLDPDGELLSATYLGGQGNATAMALSLDAAGNVYVAGSTDSPDFPGTISRLYSSSNPDLFVAKLDPSGTLLQTTLLAVPEPSSLMGEMVVDPSGAVHLVSGKTLMGIAPDDRSLLYTTTLPAYVSTLALTPDGNLLSGGWTSAVPNALLRISPTGTLLSTQSLPVSPGVIRTDAQGNLYVAGPASTGTDRPLSPSPYQSTIDVNCPNNSGGLFTRPEQRLNYMTDIYVARLDPTAQKTTAATYLGGTCAERSGDLAVDASGAFYLSGTTFSDPFPTVDPIAGPPGTEVSRPFLSHLDPDASRLVFSTYVDPGTAPRIAVDGKGNLYAFTTPGSTYPNVNRADLIRIRPGNHAALQITNVSDAFYRIHWPIAPVEMVQVDVPALRPSREVDLGFTPGAPLPTELAGVSVRINDVPAPIMAVHNGAVVCITPASLKGADHARVQVLQGENASNVLQAEVRDSLPVLFTQVRNQDGTLNTPENPARSGSTVSFFFTGAGVPDSPLADGAIVGATPPSITPPVRLSFGPLDLPLPAARAIPGFIFGLWEVRVTAPAPGSYSVRLYPTAPIMGMGYYPGVDLNVN